MKSCVQYSMRCVGMGSFVALNVFTALVWEIVCEVSFANGVKAIRYPLEYSFINRYTDDYLVSHMLKVVFE